MIDLIAVTGEGHDDPGRVLEAEVCSHSAIMLHIGLVGSLMGSRYHSSSRIWRALWKFFCGQSA